MKILHVADLHLGRLFNGWSLEDDHAAILAQILQAMAEHQPDVLIIAGDIFDRAAPPDANRQFTLTSICFGLAVSALGSETDSTPSL